MLITGHLVRLTGLRERTVQHRLGRLHRAGLVNQCRPQARVGTAPYHVWLTAIDAGPPEPWSEDPAGLQAAAVLSELWLGICERSPEVGLHLIGWRRLGDGLTWSDLAAGAMKQLPSEAELRVGLGGDVVTALVLSRVERVPTVRVVAILAQFAAYLAAGRPCPQVRSSWCLHGWSAWRLAYCRLAGRSWIRRRAVASVRLRSTPRAAGCGRVVRAATRRAWPVLVVTALQQQRTGRSDSGS